MASRASTICALVIESFAPGMRSDRDASLLAWGGGAKPFWPFIVDVGRSSTSGRRRSEFEWSKRVVRRRMKSVKEWYLVR